MPKWCAVPNCRTGSRTEQKRSIFRVPKDIILRKKWEEAISGIVKINENDVVCEKHFNDEDIVREWVKQDANGQVLARIAYKHPQLRKLAVPMKFDNEKNNYVPLHEYAKPFSELQANSLQTNIAIQFLSHTNPLIERMSTSDCIGSVPLTATENEMSSTMEVSSSEFPKAILLAPQTSSTGSSSPKNSKHTAQVLPPAVAISTDIGLSLSSIKVLSESSVVNSPASQVLEKLPSSLEISEQMPETYASISDDFSAHIPEGWCWGRMRCEIVQCTLFTYAIIKVENGVHCPVAHKSVTLDRDGTLKYFVYGRYVEPEGKNLEGVLKKKEALKCILDRFKGMNVCNGLGDIGIHLVSANAVYQDYVDKWRSKSCSMLSTMKRCDSCTKSRKCILQRIARLKNRSAMDRIGGVSKSVDKRKLLPMTKSVKRESR